MADRGKELRDRMAKRFEVDQRAALFNSRRGVTPTEPIGKKNDNVDRQMANDMLLRQNDEHLDLLGNQVDSLKNLTLDMNQEVVRGNDILKNFGVDMTKATDMMGQTAGQLQNMMDNNGGRHMWYMIMFVVFMFFLIYIMSGGQSSSASNMKAAEEVLADPPMAEG